VILRTIVDVAKGGSAQLRQKSTAFARLLMVRLVQLEK
jgi:hypothetical protein